MLTPLGAETTVLLSEPLDDLSEDDKVGGNEGSRRDDGGRDSGKWADGMRGSSRKDRRGETHCMRKGFNAVGSILDQRRPLHPMISATPARAAV